MAARVRKATSARVGAIAQTASSEGRPPGKEGDAKSERLNLRLTAEQKRAIERTAALVGPVAHRLRPEHHRPRSRAGSSATGK